MELSIHTVTYIHSIIFHIHSEQCCSKHEQRFFQKCGGSFKRVVFLAFWIILMI